MAWLDLNDISRMVGGVLLGENMAVDGVAIDTRAILPNQLFIALKGKNYDGHDFAADSIVAGAAAVMTTRRLSVAAPQIIIHNTLYALQKLAAAWRLRLRPIVIALTGSNGKTTTKEMIVSILRACKNVHATRGNLNNHIGVPLSLLGLRHEHEVAVIELGANHSGEIRRLAQLVQADIGLITNAAVAHLEGFGSVEGVARAKGELFEELATAAIAVMNADDVYYNYWRGLLSCQRCIRFGMKENIEIQGVSDGHQNSIGIDGKFYPVRLQMIGRHNFQNALAAAAVAKAIGIAPQTIVQGLADVSPVAGRMNQREGIRGSCLWDDTYNANPSSLIAALDVLHDTPGKKWLVLGNMAELGETAKQWHADAGKIAKEKGVDYLFTVGDLAASATTAFGTNAEHFLDVETLTRHLVMSIDHRTTLLIKGSRSAEMEKVVDALAVSETEP